MKHIYYFLITVLLLTTIKANAQFTNELGLPIAYWDFENNSDRNTLETTVEQQINTGNIFDGKFSGNYTGVCRRNGNGINYSGVADGSSVCTGGWVITSTYNVNSNSYYGFTINTTGFASLTLVMDLYSGGNISNYPYIGVAYSTNGGLTYTSISNGSITRNTWTSLSFTLPAACENNSNLKIKVIGYYSNNTNVCTISGPGGHLAIDNFAVYSKNLTAGTKTTLNEADIYTSYTSGTTGFLYGRYGTFTVNTGATLKVGSQLYMASVSPLNNFALSNGIVDINGQLLQLEGAVTGTGSFTGSSTSALVAYGAAGTLNFTQTNSNTRSMGYLFLGSSGTATIGTPLDLYYNVYVANTAADALNFNAQDITLKSNVNNTATIDELNATGSNLTGATNVTVERWIPLRLTSGMGSGSGNNGRAYRVLTSTVSSGTATINSSWQEGLKNTVIGVYNIPPAPYQNFGTHITGAGGSANGFDITQTNESSLYSFTNGSNINSTLGYPAITNTNLFIDGKKGYFIYIRGDRNVSTQLAYQPAGGMPTSSTTLRAKGSVLKGSINYNISATSGDFSLITNPYPAPLDWDLISAGNSNITGFYTFWNANSGIRGAFVTVPTGSSTNRYIQPGEGFFVQKNGTGGGTVTITEAMKAVGNNDNTVFFTEHTPFESFRASLYLTEATNNIRHAADDILVRYDNNYNAGVDANDAEEISNWNENIAISRGGTRLAIESRPVITDKDTIPLYIKNLRKTGYEFEFTPSLFSNTGLLAELVDNYLHTRTALSVINTVTVPFTVNNDAASFTTDRFMVVFSKPGGPLPIDMSSVKAYEKGSGIQVDWEMNTEQDMDKYEVEKSTDGRHFTAIGTVSSRGNSNTKVQYGWFDANPVTGTNYYRIHAIEKSGAYKNSEIVRVQISKGGSADISLYPNPFEGSGFNLQLNKFAAGTYTLTMYNSLGQQVYNTTLMHSGGSATQFISLGKDLAAGTYTVKITGGGTTLTRTITKK